MLLIGLFHSNHSQDEEGGPTHTRMINQEAENIPHIAGSDEGIDVWQNGHVTFDDINTAVERCSPLLKASILVEHYQRVGWDHDRMC